MLDKRTLGLILKTARKARGIRQEDIAPDAGITAAALSHIEAGRNAASPTVLKAYAHLLVNNQDVPRLLSLLSEGDPSSLSEISALLNPKDPEGFEKHIVDSRDSPGAPTRMSQWNFSRLDSVPRRALQSVTSHSVTSQTSNEKEDVMQALRSFIVGKGGRVLIAKRDSSDFGLGFSVKCDLVETTHSLVIEVKSANRFESRFIPEMVGKSVLLKEQGFRFVLCFTASPTSRLDQIAAASARHHGALVIWPETLTFDDPQKIQFGGDHLF